MRRTHCTAAIVTATAALALGLAGPALAESTTVQGKSVNGYPGNITKMVANNARTAIVAKVYGLDKPCDARQVEVSVKSHNGVQYRAMGSCYNLGETPKWNKGLYRVNDDGSTSGDSLACDDFKLTYNADHGFYKAVMPRSCVSKLQDGVRVEASGIDFDYATPGQTPWTKRLARG
jgi:hypothetical protein